MSDQVKQQGGKSRSRAISVQELLEQEQVRVPDFLKLSCNPDAGDEPLPTSYYTSREQHELEAARVWPRVWQMVCREEDVLNPGDTYLHDILDHSFIVTRLRDGSIKAFVNSCLHRGRTLREENGNVSRFRCPFHGFTWGIDGKFVGMPCKWDFKHVDTDTLDLPEVRLDTWGGFVFANIDGKAPPLLEYLGVLPEHYEHYQLDKAHKGVHVQKVVPCNWKVAHEAFMESWHTVATHPQILPFTADENTQYDTFGDHISRMITAMEVPSPHQPEVSAAEMVRISLEQSGRMAESNAEGIEVPDGVSAREFIGEMNRGAFAEASGMNLSEATLSELQDAILYDVFPNIQIWAGYFGNIVYQFRPNGDDHNSCIFDIRLLLRNPPGQEPQPGVPINRLSDEQKFTDAPELGVLGSVFEQDMGNLPNMMKGMRAAVQKHAILASYQESRIRHLYNTMAKYTAGQ